MSHKVHQSGLTIKRPPSQGTQSSETIKAFRCHETILRCFFSSPKGRVPWFLSLPLGDAVFGRVDCNSCASLVDVCSFGWKSHDVF